MLLYWYPMKVLDIELDEEILVGRSRTVDTAGVGTALVDTVVVDAVVVDAAVVDAVVDDAVVALLGVVDQFAGAQHQL